MYKIKDKEIGNYPQFRMKQFPNQCSVCLSPLHFERDFLIAEPDEDSGQIRTIFPQIQTYYRCECLDKNLAWLVYKQSVISDTDPTKNVTVLDVGHVLMNHQLLSDVYGDENIVNEDSHYHHFHRSNSDDDLICVQVPVDNILLKEYIKKITGGNFEHTENVRISCEKTIELGTSLSVLSIMNFHNPGNVNYINLQNWLGFETEIKDLLIYSGAPYWQHIKNVMMRNSVIMCVELIQSYFSNIEKSIDIANLKEARNKFIAHFDIDGDDEKTKSYIRTLYSACNKIVKSFNRKFNKDPYKLHIGLEASLIPDPQTNCDQAFKSILEKLNSVYVRYMNPDSVE